MLWAFFLTLLDSASPHIWFVRPDEPVCAGETLVVVETDLKTKNLIGLELFVNGISSYYSDKPPFEVRIDFRRFPDGPLTLKAVLSAFDAPPYTASFEGTNISHYYAEEVAFVRVPVLLRGCDQPAAPHLAKDDFVLTENGKRQKIARLLDQEAPLNVVVLLDASGSMEVSLPSVKRGFFLFLDRLRPEDRVKLIGFNEDVFQIWDFETDKELLRQKVLGLRADGDTNLYGAIWAGARAAKEASGKRAVLVFTDGHQDFSTPVRPRIDKTLEECIQMAQAGGVPVYTVGAGGSTRPEILQRIADETGGLSMALRRREAICRAFDEMGRHLGFSFVVCYYTESKRSGWHQIAVSLPDHPQWALYFPKQLYFQSKKR